MIKRNKGITLVSLVITIIVMLILAGVSLSMVTGEGSVIAQAIKASELQEMAAKKEELELILNEFNMSSVVNETLNNEKLSFSNYLEELKNKGTISEYAYMGGYLIQYKGTYFEVEKNGKSYNINYENIYGTVEEEAKDVVIAPDTIESNNGFSLESGKNYIILDSVNVSDFKFLVKENTMINIKLLGDMVIDNRDYPDRSAIDIEPTGTLNLYVYGNVKVDSSYGGTSGSGTSAEDTKGGSGGKAGIHVPKDAVLNLYGDGKIICSGGDAGDGGTCPVNDFDAGGGGGGGAGAGIGGNGGNGGDTAHSIGQDGKPGEEAGIINIFDTIEVYAYGGGGGSGGDATPTHGKGGGGGGGGYPAAGIGGGGAGGGAGCTAEAGGGYSSGGGEAQSPGGKNGLAGNADEVCHSGGGYYEDGKKGTYVAMTPGRIGGQGAWRNNGSLKGGAGGQGGAGGRVFVKGSLSRIHAYNGAYLTDVDAIKQSESWKQTNQTAIYGQFGYNINKISKDATTVKKINGRKITEIHDELKSLGEEYRNIDRTVFTTYGNIGIGTGAGYIESSNGALVVEAN